MSPYTDHEHMLAAIDHAHGRGYVLPCLVLVYTLMDSLAWLHYSNDEQSSKKRFTKWVEGFLLPNFECRCTALDLYAARCSVLHGLAWESQLTKMGQAKVLVYYIANDKKAIEEASRQIFSVDRILMVNLGGLITALKTSYGAFMAHIQSDQKLQSKIDRLLGKRYAKLTTEQFKNLASALEAVRSSKTALQPPGPLSRGRG